MALLNRYVFILLLLPLCVLVTEISSASLGKRCSGQSYKQNCAPKSPSYKCVEEKQYVQQPVQCVEAQPTYVQPVAYAQPQPGYTQTAEKCVPKTKCYCEASSKKSCYSKCK